MPKVQVLVEIVDEQPEAFGLFAAAAGPAAAVAASETYLADLAGLGLDLAGEFPPVPLFSASERAGMAAYAAAAANGPASDVASGSVVVACEIDRANLRALADRPGVRVWPNSVMESFGRARRGCDCGTASAVASASAPTGAHPFDLARTAGGTVDCRPYRPGVGIDLIRQLLAVEAVWREGFRGQNVVIGVVDDGVNNLYPVIGGHERANGPRPGTAAVTSHGSMCAADVLVAAPFAKLYDYPFLAGPNAGSSIVALGMFQAVLDRRRQDGTPHLTTNSYGFYSLPSRATDPNHEAYDPEHPLNRKVREVVASGAMCVFAAGNCGADCPADRCRTSAIGPNRSIAASNSLPEVFTVAAVNSRHERIGYSAQGPGTFGPHKPDAAAYSHFFGNFGPGRPGGLAQPYDNGTSAACPVVAGVAALLLSALPGTSPDQLRRALLATAINIGPPGWDADTGFGVVNAGAAHSFLWAGSSPV
ncbi:MAG: S8 family serine peptidase [Fimbriiglobus sp.]